MKGGEIRLPTCVHCHVANSTPLVPWLSAQRVPPTRRPAHLTAAVGPRGRALRIEPPPPERWDRRRRAAVHREDRRVGTARRPRLSATTPGPLEAC